MSENSTKKVTVTEQRIPFKDIVITKIELDENGMIDISAEYEDDGPLSEEEVTAQITEFGKLIVGQLESQIAAYSKEQNLASEEK
jgi:hypothetical protein